MKLVDVLIAITVPVVWGAGLVVAKPVLNDFPPILLMALRFLTAACALIWFVPIPKAHIKTLFWVALVGATMQYGFTFNGLRHLDAGTTALIVQAEVPFLVLVAAIVLKERIGIRKVIGMCIAFAGIYLVSGQPQLRGSAVAIAMVLIGSFFWALGQIMIRRLGDVGGLTITTWLAVMATPQLFIASLLFESGQISVITQAGISTWAAVLYLGLVMTVVGYTCWYHVLGRYPASQVGPFLLLIPITSVIGGAVFLGEQLNSFTLLGGAIVMAGVAMLVIETETDSTAGSQG